MTQTNLAIARPPRITVIDARAPEKAKLRVAAYARVSSDSDDQVNSYLAQVDHYTRHIASKEDWELVDIYADEGISGLEAQRRDDFNRMLGPGRSTGSWSSPSPASPAIPRSTSSMCGSCSGWAFPSALKRRTSTPGR